MVLRAPKFIRCWEFFNKKQYHAVNGKDILICMYVRAYKKEIDEQKFSTNMYVCSVHMEEAPYGYLQICRYKLVFSVSNVQYVSKVEKPVMF